MTEKFEVGAAARRLAANAPMDLLRETERIKSRG
jgi:hypothetical protein